MAKKFPLLILTLTISTLAATVSNQAFAAVQYDGTAWWSVAEMLDFYNRVEQEKVTLCGDDAGCTQEFNMTMVERGNKYSALNNLIEGQFWITSINPKEETVKILFFDEDRMLAHMGIKEEIRLNSFYLAWFDEWRGQIYNFYRPQFISGEIEGLHTVYDSVAEGLDVAHLPAWQEIEIPVPGSDLLLNTSGKLDHAIFGTRGFNSMGYTNYSDCINASDYEEGAECKLMISGDKWMKFFPPRAEIVEPEPSTVLDAPSIPDETGLTPDTPDTLEPTSSDVTPGPTAELGYGAASDTPESIELPINHTALDNLTKAPNTGAEPYPTENHSREINMPWWIIALIAAGIGLIVWWFIPNRKNYPKISKKSVDKTNNLR